MTTATEMPTAFRDLPGLIAEHARRAPDAPALQEDAHRLSYAQLDALMDRVAASLQRDGLAPTSVLAICAGTSVSYLAVFLGAVGLLVFFLFMAN